MKVHDLLGVGLGPFNLSLACLAEPVDDLDAVFLEARDDVAWHPGLLLPDATLQVPFLADLVTLADPTSPYSFLNYLKESGRIYPFYIRESFYPLRSEYSHYLQWAADELGSVRFGHRVEEITFDEAAECYRVRSTTASGPVEHLARRVVLGIGTSPYLPPALRGLPADRVVHAGRFLEVRDQLTGSESVAVVGSGQSAAEVFRDLLDGIGEHEYALTWLTRSPRFFPMEYTKLTLEMTSPEYSDYFRALDPATRDSLLASQRGLYKGISGDLVDDIYDTLYRTHFDSHLTTNLHTATAVVGATWDEVDCQVTLDCEHTEQGRGFSVRAERVVCATGYRAEVPSFLEPVRDRIRWDSVGRYDVAADHSIDVAGTIFVQNAEEHTHGFVAPDLGMGAYRASTILAAITGREVYPREQRIAFQEFGVPHDAPGGDVGESGLVHHESSPVGDIELRPVDADADAALLHRWVTDPKAVFWMMQETSVADVRREYRRIAENDGHEAFIGSVDREPTFLVERYDPGRSELAEHRRFGPGDVGMHVLVAPTARPVPGFTAAVMAETMRFCFADPAVERVVVEPDARNDRIAALNADAGFVVEEQLDLHDKTAVLSTCTRAQFAASRLGSRDRQTALKETSS